MGKCVQMFSVFSVATSPIFTNWFTRHWSLRHDFSELVPRHILIQAVLLTKMYGLCSGYYYIQFEIMYASRLNHVSRWNTGRVHKTFAKLILRRGFSARPIPRRFFWIQACWWTGSLQGNITLLCCQDNQLLSILLEEKKNRGTSK